MTAPINRDDQIALMKSARKRLEDQLEERRSVEALRISLAKPAPGQVIEKEESDD